MGSFTKKDLVDRVADETGERRALVKKITQEIFDQISIELSQNKRIEIRDFGIFEAKQRAARIARNPKTLDPIEVPAKRTPKFRPGSKLQKLIDSADAANKNASQGASTPATSVPKPSVPQLRLTGTESDDHHDDHRNAPPPDVHVLNGQHHPATANDSHTPR